MNVVTLNFLDAVIDDFVGLLHLRVLRAYLLCRSAGKVRLLYAAPFCPILVPRHVEELYIFESPLVVGSLFGALLDNLVVLRSALVWSS